MITYSKKKKKTTNTYTNINFNPFLPPYRKINPKWVINLNVKPKIIKLLGENLCDVGLGKDFLETIPKP